MNDHRHTLAAHTVHPEEEAANCAVKCALRGHKIIGTSGDAEHTLNPEKVEIGVVLDNEKPRLAIKVTDQAVAHHPELVGPTVLEALRKVPELAPHLPGQPGQQPSGFHMAKKYAGDTMTVSIDVPPHGGDGIIHAIGERHLAEQVRQGKTPVAGGSAVEMGAAVRLANLKAIRQLLEELEAGRSASPGLGA